MDIQMKFFFFQIGEKGKLSMTMMWLPYYYIEHMHRAAP